MVIYSPVISGSLTISGSILTPSSGLPLTGSLVSSGSFTSIGPTIISGSLSVITGSSIEFQVLDAGVKIGNIASDNHTITGSVLVSGSITTVGNITAQTLVVQTITSSVSFITGSTKFGVLAANTHQFTGSVLISGSSTALNVNSGSLFVSSSGNVGIGTTNPSYKLHVVGTGTAINLAVVGNIRAGGGGLVGGEIVASGALTNSNFIALRHDDVNGYITVTRAVYDGHLILEPYGNVGIGTTSPTAKLHISASTGAVLRVDGAGVTNTGSLFVSSSGNVGIGTLNPVSKLQVEGGTLRIGDGAGSHTGFSFTGGTLLQSNNNVVTFVGAIRVNSTAGNPSYISGSGGLAVGKTTANSYLDVNGNTLVSGSINATGPITGSSFTTTGTITAQTLVVQTITSSVSFITGSTKFGVLAANTHQFTGSMFVTGAFYVTTGSVGIGTTSPSTKLEVNDTNGVPLRFGDISTSITGQTAGYIGMSTSAYSGNNGDLVLFPRTSATSNILLMSGSVGIGTTSPNRLLTIKNSSDGANGLSFQNYASTAEVGYIRYEQTNDILDIVNTAAFAGGGIKFSTNSTERMRITSAGVVELPIGQIKFPATQNASADANTLDDYEEGTFTPTVEGSTTAGTGTYGTRQGTYTKIGNLVTINVWLQWSAHTGTGDMLLSNFPFTSIGTTSYRASGTFGWVDGLTLSANNIVTMAITPSSTKASVTQYPAGGGGAAGVSIDGAVNLHFAITYQTT